MHVPAEPPLIATAVQVPVKPSLQRPLLAIRKHCQSSRLLHSGSVLHGSAGAALALWTCTSGNLVSAQRIQPSCGTSVLLITTLLAIVASLAACWQVNMSVAVIPMAEELGWSATDRGLVSSAFFWGYSLTQIPAGYVSTK